VAFFIGFKSLKDPRGIFRTSTGLGPKEVARRDTKALATNSTAAPMHGFPMATWVTQALAADSTAATLGDSTKDLADCTAVVLDVDDHC